MSIAFMLLVSNFCVTNWSEYAVQEEPARVSELRCIRSQFTCWDSRSEEFCINTMRN